MLFRSMEASARMEEEIRAMEEQISKINPGPTKCKGCGNEVPDTAVYCPYCGSKLIEPVNPEPEPQPQQAEAEKKDDF